MSLSEELEPPGGPALAAAAVDEAANEPEAEPDPKPDAEPDAELSELPSFFLPVCR